MNKKLLKKIKIQLEIIKQKKANTKKNKGGFKS